MEEYIDYGRYTIDWKRYRPYRDLRFRDKFISIKFEEIPIPSQKGHLDWAEEEDPDAPFWDIFEAKVHTPTGKRIVVSRDFDSNFVSGYISDFIVFDLHDKFRWDDLELILGRLEDEGYIVFYTDVYAGVYTEVYADTHADIDSYIRKIPGLIYQGSISRMDSHKNHVPIWIWKKNLSHEDYVKGSDVLYREYMRYLAMEEMTRGDKYSRRMLSEFFQDYHSRGIRDKIVDLEELRSYLSDKRLNLNIDLYSKYSNYRSDDIPNGDVTLSLDGKFEYQGMTYDIYCFKKLNFLLSKGRPIDILISYFRYASLGIVYEGNLPSRIIDALELDYGITIEGYTTPFDTVLGERVGKFCSLFPDVDSVFGSIGPITEYSKTPEFKDEIVLFYPPVSSSVYIEAIPSIINECKLIIHFGKRKVKDEEQDIYPWSIFTPCSEEELETNIGMSVFLSGSENKKGDIPRLYRRIISGEREYLGDSRIRYEGENIVIEDGHDSSRYVRLFISTLQTILRLTSATRLVDLQSENVVREVSELNLLDYTNILSTYKDTQDRRTLIVAKTYSQIEEVVNHPNTSLLILDVKSAEDNGLKGTKIIFEGRSRSIFLKR